MIVNCADPDRLSHDARALGKRMPEMDDAFDDSLRGGSIVLHPRYLQIGVWVRQEGACNWCGKPLVIYHFPGQSPTGGRSCCTSHRNKLTATRKKDREAADRLATGPSKGNLRKKKWRQRQRINADAAAAAAAAAVTVPEPVVETLTELEARQAWERRMLDPAWRAANCPRPDKIVWLTRDGAEMQRRDMLGKPWFPNTDTLVAYECPCGGWHVGNSPALAARAEAAS